MFMIEHFSSTPNLIRIWKLFLIVKVKTKYDSSSQPLNIFPYRVKINNNLLGNRKKSYLEISVSTVVIYLLNS